MRLGRLGRQPGESIGLLQRERLPIVPAFPFPLRLLADVRVTSCL